MSLMMKRLLLVCLLAVAATACSASSPPPARVAAWQGDTTGMLYMRVIAPDSLQDARLTMPDGRKILARRLSQPEPHYAGSGEGWNRPSVGVGGSAGSGGGFGTGVGLSFPIGGFGWRRPAERAIDPGGIRPRSGPAGGLSRPVPCLAAGAEFRQPGRQPAGPDHSLSLWP
jgi:hypothetical protein